jgi:hypothetical protein
MKLAAYGGRFFVSPRGPAEPELMLMGARGRFQLLVALLLAVCAQVAQQATAAEPPAKIDFDRQIRPILSDKCYHCHGPDAETREADMRLDRGDGFPDYVLVPGQPEESELLRRIMAEDEAERMPPPDSHLTLSDDEKQLIARWISEGGEFTEHWSFRPLPDEVPLPNVADQAWPHNAIDRFVLSRLEDEGLSPSLAADPLRLLRRMTLDLTGLPPTREEIEAFENDAAKNPETAIEKAVDRLLANQAYGEQMAVAWLDAARYADSYGYQSDQLNTQWPYRDWVVRAFNSNLPYDKFITWQLAGDLLPRPTTDQVLATAFNRLHRLTNEGGSIAEEWLAENAADRVQTFSTALLGLTVECARCHDHKYDPISARDFYGLSAFFNSIDESGMYDHAAKVPSPSILLPTEEQKQTLQSARAKVVEAEQELAETIRSADSRFDEWLAAPSKFDAIPDEIAHVSFEGDLEESSTQNLQPEKYPPATHVQRVPGIVGQGLRFDGDFGVVLRDVFEIDRWDPFSLDFWLRDTERNPQPVVVLHRSRGTDVGYNGFDVMLADGVIELRMYRVWPGNAIGVRATEPIEQDRWQHLSITYDGSSRAGGLRLFVDGKEVPTAVLRDHVHKSVAQIAHGKGYLTLGERFRDRGFRNGELDELRIFERAISPLEVRQLHDGQSLIVALDRPGANRDAVREFYTSAFDQETKQRRLELRNARHELVEAEEPIQEVPVMEELATARPTYILQRGAYNAPKTDDLRVERDAFEAMLTPFPADAPRDRLGLAEWMTDPNHPLTARVFVNRVWANFFGRGLVATPENFGRQGALPTHPELLDWLARDFVDHGWDIKRLCRQILQSATYQQDSRLRPELREQDPENLLLARGPSRRLSAEQIRDVSLAASGLLNAEMGGPPVSPYQPGEDLWRESNVMSPAYHQSVGESLYRRSIYSVWKRTAPLPNMSVFDSPTREVCVVSRGSTSTPLQALVLLNDVQFVEAARGLAQSVARAQKQIDDQIAEAFLRLTGRTPDARETKLLRQVYDTQHALFADGSVQDPQAYLEHGDSKVDAELAPADLAALAATCQVILNLDATIYNR